ncbi:type I-G CRISPR-associated protein, Cas3-extension family [Streptomyces nigrescens]|uniref:type I-G CRISPR-associated protein, Cas3-extension family n=1 Tax=Streptomyces nigrescens TaxID=1920 RepID=UPI0037018846
MQHELELPALRGDSALGFLAALGVLELTALTLDRTPRLSWHGPTGPAILHTHQPFTHESLAGLLQTHVPEKPADEPLPAAPGILSLSRHKADGAATPNEPLRMPIALALQRLREHTNAERLSHSPGARWFTALVNQLNLGPATSGSQPGPIETLYTKTTPLFSPSGQMTLANNWAKAAEHCRHDPTHLLASLTSWRRVEKYAGANLDFGSTGDAHMSSHGKAAQQGVPGATWLALHAFAAFRLTGTARHGRATGWERTPTGPALTWPTWHPPLTPTAITTLLEHPLLRAPNPEPAKLSNLGVTARYIAARSRLSNSYGPLQPATLVTPPTTSP